MVFRRRTDLDPALGNWDSLPQLSTRELLSQDLRNPVLFPVSFLFLTFSPYQNNMATVRQMRDLGWVVGVGGRSDRMNFGIKQTWFKIPSLPLLVI